MKTTAHVTPESLSAVARAMAAIGESMKAGMTQLAKAFRCTFLVNRRTRTACLQGQVDKAMWYASEHHRRKQSYCSTGD